MIQARTTPTRLAPFLALALFAGACKSTTADKGAATAKNIRYAADEIRTGLGQLDSALAALNNLVNEPAADLEPQYKAFSKHLKELESTAANVREAAAAMEAKGKAYFADWDAQLAAIQNEDIRERSAERRAAVEADLKEIQEQYTESRDTFRPLMNDLVDIRTALGADLTMNGLSAVKKSVKNVNDEAKELKKNLQGLADSFRELGVSLSQSGPPQPEKKEEAKK